ncbi:hypothetical protein [Streptomyces microflavus]|uniref:hypothetical protein n=1 Tax=Streptomyces microflavus TaxID=1919 RepID=UPI0037FF2FCF
MKAAAPTPIKRWSAASSSIQAEHCRCSRSSLAFFARHSNSAVRLRDLLCGGGALHAVRVVSALVPDSSLRARNTTEGFALGPVNREHLDTADTLEAMCDEHLVLAHAVHCAPGAHRVQPESTAMRTVVDSVRSVRWMCCAGDDG